MFNVWEGMVINRLLVEELRLNYLQEKGVIRTHIHPLAANSAFIYRYKHAFICFTVYLYTCIIHIIDCISIG